MEVSIRSALHKVLITLATAVTDRLCLVLITACDDIASLALLFFQIKLVVLVSCFFHR